MKIEAHNAQTLEQRKQDATTQHHESARLIVYKLQLHQALYSCDYCNAITIWKMSKNKHIFLGKYVKELNSARSRIGFGYKFRDVCDSQIY